ncbi:MAG TPA: alpha/beta hydrolase [Deinococcales bacterium]|nr:alpha/beta hydrolase [Deinococcales bacterium]
MTPTPETHRPENLQPDGRAAGLAYLSGGQGRPIVAVHGAFASRNWMRPLVSTPPSGWQVIAPSLPGYAGSLDAATEPTIPAFADALERFIAALGLDRPVLLGHSLGGAVVLETASRHLENYRAVVTVSGPPLDGFPHNAAFDEMRQRCQTDRTLLRTVLAAQAPGLDAAGLEAMGFEALLDDAQAMHDDWYSGPARALGEWNITGRAAALSRLPMLVLSGSRDPLVLPDFTRKLAGQLPHARLAWVEGAGHWALQERETEFRQLLDGFLAAVA